MYHVDYRGWSKVKGVIIVVSVVVCEKRCKVGVVVHVKDGGRVKEGVG